MVQREPVCVPILVMAKGLSSGPDSGRPFDRPAIYDKIRAALDALAKLVEAVLYVCERWVNLEVAYHFDSVDAWLAYRAAGGSAAVVEPTLQARAPELLTAAVSGELLIRDQMRVTRHRRTRPDSR